MVTNLKDIDVLILCGGLGKRLRSIIYDRPKPMAEINHHPFLDFLIDYVFSYGVRKIILCTGYRSNFIKRYYANSNYARKILFSKEHSLLGTAGAIKNAQGLIKSNPFLAMNGDSICRINLNGFLDFHMSKKALVSIALTKNKNIDGVGIIELDDSQKILAFHEKVKNINLNNRFINAGIYIFNKKVFSAIPKNQNYSLEYDLFPNLNRCYGYVAKKNLFDIGTPKSYKKAKKFLIK